MIDVPPFVHSENAHYYCGALSIAVQHGKVLRRVRTTLQPDAYREFIDAGYDTTVFRESFREGFLLFGIHCLFSTPTGVGIDVYCEQLGDGSSSLLSGGVYLNYHIASVGSHKTTIGQWIAYMLTQLCLSPVTSDVDAVLYDVVMENAEVALLPADQFFKVNRRRRRRWHARWSDAWTLVRSIQPQDVTATIKLHKLGAAVDEEYVGIFDSKSYTSDFNDTLERYNYHRREVQLVQL